MALATARMSDAPGDFTLNGIEVRGQSRVVNRFANATKGLHDRLLAIITDEVEQVAQQARGRAAELFRNPSAIQNAISTAVEDGTTFIQGRVTASGLPYLRIHEYGGRTTPHDIFPVNARALHWFSPSAAVFRPGAEAASNEVFAKSVHHPGSMMPERSFMRYGLAQRAATIRARFRAAAIERDD